MLATGEVHCSTCEATVIVFPHTLYGIVPSSSRPGRSSRKLSAPRRTGSGSMSPTRPGRGRVRSPPAARPRSPMAAPDTPHRSVSTSSRASRTGNRRRDGFRSELLVGVGCPAYESPSDRPEDEPGPGANPDREAAGLRRRSGSGRRVGRCWRRVRLGDRPVAQPIRSHQPATNRVVASIRVASAWDIAVSDGAVWGAAVRAVRGRGVWAYDQLRQAIIRISD